MAVYTAPSREALSAWLVPRGIGTLVEFEGIRAGIENSNFFVTTRDGDDLRRYVLTIFERLSTDELPYYLSLMQHLATHGVPCPAPVADEDGALCAPLAGKPAALVTRLGGASVVAPGIRHCAEMGRALARMHRAAADFRITQANARGIDWWIATAAAVRDDLDDAQRALLDDEIALQSSRWKSLTTGLPRSGVHLDLFRDNALFVEQADGGIALGGVIDFYFAGDDVWVLDLAICLNDWCVDPADGTFDVATLQAFVGAYEAERPLTDGERAALPTMLRAAALRFWLSRLDDLHRPRPAELLVPHDPAHFERILRRRRAEMMDGIDPLSPRAATAIDVAPAVVPCRH